MKAYPTILVSILIISSSSCLWRTAEQHEDGDNCIHKCGNISLPYPFGIGPKGCYLDPYFEVSCLSSSSSPGPFLKILNLEIIEVQISSRNVLVKIIQSVTACNGTELHWRSPSLVSSPFSFWGQNVFVSIGCQGYALIYSDSSIADEFDKGGCTSICANSYQEVETTTPDNLLVPCYGFNNCCQIDIPLYGNQYRISVSAKNGLENCRSAFLISRQSLPTIASTIPAMSSAAFPVMLIWDIGSGFGEDYSGSLWIDIVCFVAITSILAFCCVGLCWWCKTKKRRKEVRLRKKYFMGRLSEEERFKEEAIRKTKLFTIKELKKATDNFDEDRIIGKGGQGTVYKGMLPDGELIAVKKSMSLSESHWKEFINEVIILSLVNHRNVVKLFGCCLEARNLLLVYEFIPNGTLYQLLHSPSDEENQEIIAPWDIRLRMASEVAGAIAYLHSTSSTPILHRDIKTMNILLDHKYKAKVCDFGISRTTSVDQTHLTTLVKGTFGYIDPQYFRSNQFTEKSDVYSFGVVLFEMLTGQKPIRHTSNDYAMSAVIEFASLTNHSDLIAMLDPMVRESSSKIEDIMALVNLAKCCLHPQRDGRPTMMQVSFELANLSRNLSS